MLQMKPFTRRALFVSAALTLTTASGCLDHPLKPAESDSSQVKEDQIQLNVNKDVDILFVIDNSGSMGEEQANLAANFDAFINVLEDPAVKANYRLGVTTSDMDNPRCDGTTPEKGHLVYQSCTDRLGQFVSLDGTTDVGNIACSNQCGLSSGQLGITSDSKPWLESIEGVANLPDGVSTTQAFQCLGPQGINGCGFESQLESMNFSLIRMESQDEPEFGFLRDNAILAIIQVTDEADCSYNPQIANEIFLSNQTFWYSGPDALPYSTSAVCWNAGVKCVDNGGTLNCESADYDISGNEITDASAAEDSAVLFPVSRYISRVQGIENFKKDSNANQEVIVGLIGGVADDGQPSYANSSDTSFMASFGIGAGCSAPVEGSVACTDNTQCAGIGTQSCGAGGFCVEQQTAIPPVRLAEFTDNFTDDNMFTICSGDYTPALNAIAEAIADQLKPACYTECVQDQNLQTPGLVEPECVVTERINQVDNELSECLKDANGYVPDPVTAYTMPDDSTNVCYAILTDVSGATADPLDDISTDCSVEGYNLEFKLARRQGFPAQGGSSVSAQCILSELPQIDCENL